MNKNPNRKLFVTLIFAILLISTVCAVLTPSTNAAQPSVQEKGLSIFSNVLNLNLANYNVTTKEGPQDYYMNVLPEENLRYTFESKESKVDTLCTFTNGNLRMMQVLDVQGPPTMTKSATKQLALGNATIEVVDLTETANNFLNDYQSFTGRSIYSKLGSMLDNVENYKNSTEVAGDVKFDVTVTGDTTVFKWTYINNSMEAPDKCIALGYKSGFLQYFIDNWGLYKIGSTDVNLTEKEAIDIAIKNAKTFSWNMSTENDEAVAISNFNITSAMIWDNLFASSLYADTARNEDQLTLYPMRHVWISFDKYYPGNVYGLEVYIWADTKDVAHIEERISTLDPPTNLVASSNDYTVKAFNGQTSLESNTSLFSSIALLSFAGLTLGSIPVWVAICKKKNLPKSQRTGGILLFMLLSSTVSLTPISLVSADPNRGSLVFGSRSDDAMTNPPNSYHWRKTADELYRQGVTSNAINNYFRDDGYAAENNQGNPGSHKDNILAKIDSKADAHSLVALVDFDHGVGNPIDGEFHFMFEDNRGTKVGAPPGNPVITNGVYDYEIYRKTSEYSPSKYFFTYINTCMSANLTNIYTGEYWQGYVNGKARGMPYAFTGREVVDYPNSNQLSKNGYLYPDGSPFAYIGFPFGSAALAQTITGVSPIYATWLENFFWYALSFDISVNDALDEATLRNYNCLFGSSALATGFMAQWPMDTDGDGIWEPNNGPNSTLVLYGNGNIHLYQYFMHDYMDATWYGYYAGVSNPDGIEGGRNDGNYAYLYATGWYGDQAVILGSMGNEAKGHVYLYGYTDSGFNSHVSVWAAYDYGGPWYPVNENLWVSQTAPGWINVGSYGSNFRYFAVAVYADQAPATLYVDSVLVIPQPQQSPHYWVSSIASTTPYGYGAINDPENMKHSYNDGSFTQLYGGNPGDGAEIVGTLNRASHGHIYLWGYSYSGYYTHLYSSVSNNGYTWYDTTIPVQTVDYRSGTYWIDCGSYGSDFRYIKLKAIDDNGMSARLLVDAVKVVP